MSSKGSPEFKGSGVRGSREMEPRPLRQANPLRAPGGGALGPDHLRPAVGGAAAPSTHGAMGKG